MTDDINHPKHYTSHPSGVECITIVEHFSFNIGNAIKYLWRAGLKGEAAEDLAKALWYIERELKLRNPIKEVDACCWAITTTGTHGLNCPKRLLCCDQPVDGKHARWCVHGDSFKPTTPS